MENSYPEDIRMPLPGPRSHEEANASGPQAPKSLLPDNSPQEFRVLLSACRVFLGTEEPSKLEALLSRGTEWERLLALSNMRGNSAVVPFCNAFEVGRGRNDPKIALYR
jgi:hypothetical protein